MKVTILIHNQVNTGPFYKVLDLCKALVKLECQVFLICTSQTKKIRDFTYKIEGVEIYEAPDLLLGKLRQGFDFWNAFNRYRRGMSIPCDVVHVIDCRPNVIIPALMLKYRLKVPLIISWWDLFGNGGTSTERSGKLFTLLFGWIETLFEVKFRKYATLSTVISSNLAERLKSLNYPSKNIYLLRTGSNSEDFTISNPQTVRNKLNLPISKTIFCYVGSIFKRDLQLLLNSLRVLKSLSGEQPLILLIGNHFLTNSICSEFNIIQTGFIKSFCEYRDYLLASDFGLLPLIISPANNARWPSKITDYWFASLPVLATPVGDLTEIFSKHKLGILSTNGTPENYADVLSQAMLMPLQEREKLSQSSKTFAENEFDWKVIAYKQKEIYLKALLKYK